MDREEALGLLDARLGQYRRLPYAELAQVTQLLVRSTMK